MNAVNMFRDNVFRGGVGRYAMLAAVLAVGGLRLLAGTEGGDSPLVTAARSHDLKAISAMLAQKPDVNARSSDGSTALLWVTHWNDLDTANLLLAAGADANAANDFRMTPLSQACINGNAALVHVLLKAGANPMISLLDGVVQVIRYRNWVGQAWGW